MFIMKILLLLSLLTVSGCLSNRVVGQTGENITFTCKYDIKYYKALPACWNRGDIPSQGMCNKQLISTDGNKVIKESGGSSRYQLMGRLNQGDISLTILNLTEKDEGRYGCRVNIPGWFNDQKHHFDLTVEGPQVIMTTWTAAETSTESTPANQTEDHMTSTRRQTPSSSGVSSNEPQKKESSSLMVILGCVLFGIVALLITVGIIFITRRWKRLNKMPQQQIRSLDQFNSTSSTLQLHNRGSTVENIYQIDGGDYEYCP